MYSTASSSPIDRALGREIAHQDVLADRWPRSGARDVGPPALAVDQRLTLRRHDRLVAEHVAPDAGGRCVVVDRQRAHHGSLLLLPVAQVRFPADELLVLGLAPGHPGLDDVVVGLEFRPVGAVALLEPSRGAVDADAGGNDAVRRAGLRNDLPQARSLLDRDVELPAEIAHIRDPRDQDLERTDLDHPAARERKPLVRDVLTGGAGQDVSRPRTPEPERAPGVCLVVDLRRTILGEVIGEPLEIRHPVRTAGDDAEAVLVQLA